MKTYEIVTYEMLADWKPGTPRPRKVWTTIDARSGVAALDAFVARVDDPAIRRVGHHVPVLGIGYFKAELKP